MPGSHWWCYEAEVQDFDAFLANQEKINLNNYERDIVLISRFRIGYLNFGASFEHPLQLVWQSSTKIIKRPIIYIEII